MKKIAIVSDTHGHIEEGFKKHIRECDEVWHAGDFGSNKIAEELQQLSTLRGVYGNIDGQDIRSVFPQVNRFEIEGVDVILKHIVGYPGNYDFSIRKYLQQNPPKLLIAGHSHILKIQNDQQLNLLHINPGAAGRSGFHSVITMVKIKIDDGKIFDCEVVEIER